MRYGLPSVPCRPPPSLTSRLEEFTPSMAGSCCPTSHRYLKEAVPAARVPVDGLQWIKSQLHFDLVEFEHSQQRIRGCSGTMTKPKLRHIATSEILRHARNRIDGQCLVLRSIRKDAVIFTDSIGLEWRGGKSCS